MTTNAGESQGRPKIVLVYADDLGYGDLHCYNAASKIPTPNLDRLAGQGVAFMDAHAPAAICGPSRYGLLTGRYPWRNPLGIELGHPYDQCKIEDGRMTLGHLLQGLGYHTAEMGKWGLRYDYRSALRDPDTPLDETSPDSFDWHGFLPQITARAVDYIEAHTGKRTRPAFKIGSRQPFFLYFDPHVPHEPLVPNAPFVGKTAAGEYGDFVMEFDDSVGQLMQTLEENGLAENTVFIVSSDNGPESTCYERIRWPRR